MLFVQVKMRIEANVPEIGVLPDDHNSPRISGETHRLYDRNWSTRRLNCYVYASAIGTIENPC